MTREALVIGGGGNMGKASSQLLAKAGADVVVLDIDEEHARSTADSIVAEGGRANPLVADVLDAQSGADAVAEAARLLGGKLDILVNVVGAPAWAPAIDTTVEDWERNQVRNLRHIFTTAQAFARLPSDPDTSRAIACITSISGLNSAPNHVPYGAAKAGLMSLVRTLAQEWGPLGIRVNSIAPGVIRTDRMGDDLDVLASPVAPLRRLGSVMEIGKTVLFLVSDLASYITGHMIVVDGGLLTNFPFPITEAR